MRIYVSGNIVGSYRSQNIIKTFADNKISFFYMGKDFYKPALRYKLPSRILQVAGLVLSIPIRVLMVAMASHVFVLPMNTNIIAIFDISLAKLLRKKIIVDYYISDYDTLVNDRKSKRKDSLAGKWSLFKDRFLLCAANKVIFLNQAESNYYQKVAGVSVQDKSVIIPLCVDYKKEAFKTRPKRDDEIFKVCWWGTYIPLHGLEALIRSYSYIERGDIKLYLFGDSDEKGRPYKKLIQEAGLDTKIFMNNECTFANGKLSTFLISNCDLAIGNFGNSDKAKTVLVNKLVDALSLGIPCLTRETEASRELLEGNKGIITTDINPQEIANNIIWACEQRHSLAAIGDEGKGLYFSKFSPDVFSEKLLTLLKE